MSVISITIEISEEEIVSGIPKYVDLSTNIPATIFYTLDGTDPNYDSFIYTERIYLSASKQSITLKIIANNGTDSSSIITEVYETSILDSRLSKFTTSSSSNDNLYSLYPFGTNEPQPVPDYLLPGNPSLTVYDESLPVYSSGYNADGTQSSLSNEEFTIENYNIVYSKTNAIGEMGPFIGNVPGKILTEEINLPISETNQFTNTFDPRAFVIFQDFTNKDPADESVVNRQFFSLESEFNRDGNKYYATSIDSSPLSGSALKSYYNPNDDTIKYYYFDSWANRWIISTQKFERTSNYDGNMAQTPSSSRHPGSKYVLEWVPFQRRVLF